MAASLPYSIWSGFKTHMHLTSHVFIFNVSVQIHFHTDVVIFIVFLIHAKCLHLPASPRQRFWKLLICRKIRQLSDSDKIIFGFTYLVSTAPMWWFTLMPGNGLPDN